MTQRPTIKQPTTDMLNLKSASFLSLPKLRAGSKTFLTILGMTVVGALTAHAQLINANIYDTAMVGTAVLGNGTTDEWNHVSFNNSSTGALVDSTGSSNPLAPVTLTSGNWFIGADGSAGDGPLDGNPNLFSTYAVGYGFLNPVPADPSTLDFSGLADNQEYELVLYSRNQPGGNGREFTVSTTGVSGTISETLVNAENAGFSSVLDPTESSTYGDPTYDGNFIALDVESTSGGELNLNLSSAGEYSEYDVSGLQLEAVVPEPSMMALMATGLAGLTLLVRRNRRLLGTRI